MQGNWGGPRFEAPKFDTDVLVLARMSQLIWIQREILGFTGVFKKIGAIFDIFKKLITKMLWQNSRLVIHRTEPEQKVSLESRCDTQEDTTFRNFLDLQ